MRPLTNRSLKTKLLALTTACVLVALVTACGAFVVSHVKALQAANERQLSMLVDVLSSNCIAALDFDDRETAGELLGALREVPSIQSAAIYDFKGRQFATFTSSSEASCPVQTPSVKGPQIRRRGILELTRSIRRDGEVIGTIYLRSDMRDVEQQLGKDVVIIAFAAVIALGVSFLFSTRLQQGIAAPILRLVRVMHRVADEDNYALRTSDDGADEIGQLCRGFNDMLSQVETARAELRNANDGLETRVNRRTEELARTNEELRVAIGEAEAASRAKSDFLANMSHEIRTPMTAILGYLDLLADRTLPQQVQNEYLHTIQRNGRNLLCIINDILDVSKIEAGKLTVETVTCSPTQIAAEVLSLVRSRAKEKGLNLEAVFLTEVPETIQTDPTRLKQILTNLIGNAVKFTKEGSVRLEIALEGLDNSQQRLRFNVVDTGIGMSFEQLATVFEPFTQADESMTRKFGGTGLGLTIARQLAGLLGGELTASSTLGEGSSFSATIAVGSLQDVPLHRNCEAVQESMQPVATTKVSKTSLSGMRILLAEDGVDNQRLIGILLKKAGAVVQIVENGKLAVNAAIGAQEKGSPFDVILMDMQMPVMDGYTATGILREQAYERPIIALTAHTMTGDRQRCLDAGCDEYTSKPVNRETLLGVVALWGAKREAVATV